MSVTLSLPTILSRLTDGQSTLEADGATVGEVVTQVADRFPRLAPRLKDEHGGPYPFVGFYLNDRGHPVPRRVRGAGDRGRRDHRGDRGGRRLGTGSNSCDYGHAFQLSIVLLIWA